MIRLVVSVLALASLSWANQGRTTLDRAGGTVRDRVDQVERNAAPKRGFETENASDSTGHRGTAAPRTDWTHHETGGDYVLCIKFNDETTICRRVGDSAGDPKMPIDETDPTLTDDGTVTIGSGLTVEDTLIWDVSGTDGQLRWNGDDVTFLMNGSLGLSRNLNILNGNEARFWDVGNSNYVGFEARALTGNQIWRLPPADGNEHDILQTNGSGTLSWERRLQPLSLSIVTGIGAGDHYFQGFYVFSGTNNDFDPSITFGTANNPYAAHFFVVIGAELDDPTYVIQVSGTSITDPGVVTAADTVTMVFDGTEPLNSYKETSIKWLGTVAVELLDGTATQMNYGFVKYWDNNNADFTLRGVNATWMSGQTDASAALHIHHHKATGWTYNLAADATPPGPFGDSNSDNNNLGTINNEQGAWKRSNYSQAITGDDGEGIILKAHVEAAGKAFEFGTIHVYYTE